MRRILLPLLLAAVATGFAGSVYALDPPHDSTNAIDCANCHTSHKALGGAITKVAGNANLCQSCHTTGGTASLYPFDEADQALPRWGLPPGMSPSGTSHRWDSGVAGHAKAVGTPGGSGTVESGGSFTGTSAKTYTITIATAGDVGVATFNWTDTRGCANATVVTTGVDVALNDTDAGDDPPEGCGNQGVTVTFTNGATPGSCGSSFCANDQWRVYVRTEIRTPITAAMAVRVDSNGKIMCSTCHDQHSQERTPYDPSAPAYGGPGTGAGRHFQRIDNDINQMCEDCHNAKTLDGSRSHRPSNPLVTIRCMTCHTVHYAPTSDGSLTVLAEENLCYNCHDGTIQGVADIFSQFNGATNFQVAGGINQRHDVSDADQTFSGGVVECVNCHNPHSLTGTNKLINPDWWSDGTTTFVEGQPFTKTYSTSNQYGTETYRSAGTDQDPVNPEGAGAAIIGDAEEGVHNGDDLGISNAGPGTYTGTEHVTYTVTISPGGAPGSGAGISVTSDGTDCPPSSPCTQTVPAFDTFVNVGNFGVQIKFTASSVGPVVDPPPANDDTAASGGTYNGTVNGTYTVTVTTGGRPRNAVVQCTGLDCGAGTPVCRPSASGGPECDYGTAFAVGSNGVTITFTDTGARDFNAGDDWTIAVTAPSGDGVLTLNDTWTIEVFPAGFVFSEPDYVAFCLTCHDNSQPTGVTMTAGLTDISAEYFSTDVMGARPGGTGTSIGNGYLKNPWHTQPASCSAAGGWTGCEDPTEVYAALNCTVCHDGHGSDSLYHLRTRIKVAGYQLTVGGDNPNSQFGPTSTFASTLRYLSTTYSLPCQGGNGEPDCADNPGGAQQDLYFGAWCSFCHEMSSHPSKTETGSSGSCVGSHTHGGGNF